MYKHIIKKYWIFFLIFWLLIAAGCTQFSLNLQDRIKAINNCQISVIDSRPDKRIFINSLTIKPIPPISEILHSKLCQRDEIQKVTREGIELEVYISNIRCELIKHFLHWELIGSMTGEIQIRKPGEKDFHEYLIMPSFTKQEKSVFARRTAYKEFIDSIIENFVVEIEKNIYKIND